MEMFNSLKEISSYTQAHQVLWNAQIELLTLCNFACQHYVVSYRKQILVLPVPIKF